MEGILIDMVSFAPVGVFFAGGILLALVATAILLGYTAEEETSGKEIFWAESPFTDVSVSEAPVERVKYLRAA